VSVTFWPLIITCRSPFATRLHGTPQAASSRTAFGAVSTNMRTTRWSAPQSLPRTVSSKWTSSLSPCPLTTLPSDACMPPWAAAQFDDEGQHQVERPVVIAPDPVGALERTDPLGPHQHRMQVDRGEEEHREAGHDLPPPERRVGVLHRADVVAERAVLAVVDR